MSKEENAYAKFRSGLETAKTEEGVKAAYASYFELTYDTADKHDLYTPQVLFEFKYDRNFENIKIRATILAQILYYVRRLKFEGVQKQIPYYLCLADKNEAVITETSTWKAYYSSDSYDWNRAASKPDPKLIDHLIKEPDVTNLHVYQLDKKREHNAFKKKLNDALHPQLAFPLPDKKIINEENFEAVYAHWKETFEAQIINGYKLPHYFLANLQEERIIIDQNSARVVFTFEDGNSRTQKIIKRNYDYFWGMYAQVQNIDTIKGINTKLDRLTDDSVRRLEGEFYTPLRFTKKAIHYISDVLGKNWYKTGKYRIWDMAAGTGNLEWYLPAEAYQYLYMSTLHSSDVDHNKKVFPNATCFQYDYLNDDIEYLFLDNALNLPVSITWKLPQKLRDELADDSLTWLVFINPPFATAQVGGATGDSKTGVSKTKIEIEMTEKGVGHTKRELFAQFMYRIRKEMPKNTVLAMFSKLKYLNAPDSIAYRDKYFDYKYKKGFIFKSTNFQGVKGKYPIGFLIWDLSHSRPLGVKTVPLDICNNDGVVVGEKHLSLIQTEDVLNKWFSRPQNSNQYILPPLSNAITVKDGNVDRRHRARHDFLASVCSNGNDFQHAKYVVILSSPNVSAGAFTVNEGVFEKSMVLHAVKKVPKPTWLNDRNQFLTPRVELPEEFMNDCVIWSLFANSNETASLRDVVYLGKTYQIKNNFFPFVIEEMKKWTIKDPDFKLELASDEDRFVAIWLQQASLSEEAKVVMERGEAVYKLFYRSLNDLPTHTYKIRNWDAGWYQIRRTMTDNNLGIDELRDLRDVHTLLAEKLLPQIEAYGFLDKDVIYDNSIEN